MKSFVLVLTFVVFTLWAPASYAQFPGVGGGGMGGRSPNTAPTQSSPTKNTSVGPRSAQPNPDDDEEEVRSQLNQRTEPTLAPPANPLALSPELRLRLGSDAEGSVPAPTPFGDLQRSFFPYYEESRGDYRFRILPPFWLEHTRGLPTEAGSGEPTSPDRESLYGLFYYQRRSYRLDMDVAFPVVWNVWNKDTGSRTIVVGPIAHRTAPFENDNWFAPLYFEGARKDGGYFHSPVLLTSTHWDEKGAFTVSGPYFRSRTLKDVDWGLVPLYFHGDNGNDEGANKVYSIVPPLLYYHEATEIDSSAISVVGPLIFKSTPKRSAFDVAPLFFHIEGRPESGGIKESHTTLFPLFHYGKSEAESLFVIPGYLRRVTKTVDTMLSPFYSFSTTRNGATRTTALGPIVPLYYHYSDYDTGLSTWFLAPFYLHSSGPEERAFLTPLVGRFETYGESRTWWLFPTIVSSNDRHGWEDDLHPLVYMGRSDKSSHAVLAPILWDFASPEKRTTIIPPLFWRFQDNEDKSILQIAANTLYLQKKVEGGIDWQFHVLPLFSYGEDPQGYFWNVLFGLAGFQKEGSFARIRALWVPITVKGAPSETALGVPGVKF